MKEAKVIKCGVGFVFILILSSCAKNPINQTLINDSEMILAMKKLEKMELNFMLYREGSSGANGGKNGGGCGCN